MARQWRFHDGFTANLLLPSFSLARTRSILISIHQARNKVRCYRYDKRICNYRENSNAFKNSVPNSCSKRSFVLIPDTRGIIGMKTTGVINLNSPFHGFFHLPAIQIHLQPGARICTHEHLGIKDIFFSFFYWKCQCSLLKNSQDQT